MKLSLRRFWAERQEWSFKTFGNRPHRVFIDEGNASYTRLAGRGPMGPLKHLAKEVQEAIDKPDDLIEYADMIHLIFDACDRAGYTYDELIFACFGKLAKNKKRKWPKPDSDEPVEHVKGVND